MIGTAGQPPAVRLLEEVAVSDWPRQSPIDVALRGVCPRCGQGKLFRGLLTIVERCPVCGLDLRGTTRATGRRCS